MLQRPPLAPTDSALTNCHCEAQKKTKNKWLVDWMAVGHVQCCKGWLKFLLLIHVDVIFGINTNWSVDIDSPVRFLRVICSWTDSHTWKINLLLIYYAIFAINETVCLVKHLGNLTYKIEFSKFYSDPIKWILSFWGFYVDFHFHVIYSGRGGISSFLSTL